MTKLGKIALGLCVDELVDNPIEKATADMIRHFNTVDDKIFKKLLALCGYDLNYVLAHRDEFMSEKTKWESGGYDVYSFYHHDKKLFEIFRRDELIESNLKGPTFSMKWVRRESYHIFDEQLGWKQVQINLEEE